MGNLPDHYRGTPAKPTIYKGTQMRSALEANTARALDHLNLQWIYEPDRFADDYGLYTPDFRIPSLRVIGWPGYNQSQLYVEARPDWNEGFRKQAEQNFATLKASTDDPLLFVGMNKMPAALLGWCFGITQEPVLGVIGQWRNLRIDRSHDKPSPCLYVNVAAVAWFEGLMMGGYTQKN